ncbi:unnamed protein product [Amoebophrya sp. A25]|nr:unnamed protein product [Amoebophrya sp. A25]|eukprot:GSA25T00027849001.1
MQAALAKLAANYGLGQGQQMDDTESVMFTEFERTWRKAAGDRGRLDAAVKNRLFAHAVEILFELMKPNSMADGYACTEAQLLGSLNTKFEQLTSEGPLAKAVHDTLADSFKALRVREQGGLLCSPLSNCHRSCQSCMGSPLRASLSFMSVGATLDWFT